MPDRPQPIEMSDETPALHRVLVPGGEVLYVYGVLGHFEELREVPLIVHQREVVGILPLCCVIERWTKDEPLHRAWSLIYGPPAGIDVSWLTEHPDWVTA